MPKRSNGESFGDECRVGSGNSRDELLSQGDEMKKLIAAVAALLLITVGSAPSEAKGRYKWWAISSETDWFSNGIVCWDKGGDIKVGNKATFSVKLGQVSGYKTLGKAVGLPGNTLVNSENGKPIDLNQTDGNGNYVDSDGYQIETMEACDGGSNDVAFISPKTPSTPGAYSLKIAMHTSSGRFLWNDYSKVLQADIGADYGTSYFTNPPAIYFSSSTYTYMGSGYGLIPYTSRGSKRNACLVIRDFIFSTVNVSLTKQDIIYSAQRGNLRTNLSTYINASAPPIAIKCAPWMADYLP